MYLILTLLLTLTLTLKTTAKPYTNITFIGSHDAPFTGSLPQQNQNLNVTAQLDLGIRFLQGQTHLSLGLDAPTDTDDKQKLDLCHSSCLLEDAGPLVDFLNLVKNWLDQKENKKEVVTLLLTNGDRVDVGVFARAFEESSLDQLAFVPGSGLALDEWPSVEAMVDMGKRVVVFLGTLPAPPVSSPVCHITLMSTGGDYNANISTTPYILDEFTYFFETPFDVTDARFSNCSVDRPPGANPDHRMYIVNHFLDVDILGVKVPDRAHADRTNAVEGEGGIVQNARRCAGLYGRVPNVVLLDFVDKGEAIKAQRILRG